MEKERIEKMIKSTFECVNLIEELNSVPSLDDKQLDRLKRAKEHIKIILNRDWITNSLTNQQIETLNSYI
jgi:hypothetical protein